MLENNGLFIWSLQNLVNNPLFYNIGHLLGHEPIHSNGHKKSGDILNWNHFGTAMIEQKFKNPHF